MSVLRIERTRYVVMRRNRTEIWCGLSRELFHFVKVDELKDTVQRLGASLHPVPGLPVQGRQRVPRPWALPEPRNQRNY